MAENEKKVAVKTEKPKSDKPSIWKRIGAWFKSLKSECKKISWASWKSVRTNTIIVLVCIVIFAVAIGILDYLFSGAIQGLNGLVNLVRG